MKNYTGIMILLFLLQPISSLAISTGELIEAALQRTHHQVSYDGRYYAIDYPGGDVPENIGVCTDVVIRSYRKLGIDLQKLVHLDMKNHFSEYP